MDYKLKTFEVPMDVTRIANVHYFEFTDEYHTTRNRHNFCELLYVDKGSICVRAERYEGTLSDNQLLIHRPNEEHFLECGNHVAPNVIIIGFECVCEALAPFSRSPVTLSAEQKKMLADVMQEGMNVFAPPYDLPDQADMKKREKVPFGADQMLKLRLESFLISLVRGSQREESAHFPGFSDGQGIAAVRQYLSEHYAEKIPLDNLCFLFGTNKTTLCKSFKEQYGTTILNYLNSMKIREAKAMLRENGMSITEISEKLGFNSIHYFCRQFKKETGQAPKEYAKTIRSRLDL